MIVRFGWICLLFWLIGLAACNISRKSTESKPENIDVLFPGEKSDSLVAYLERTRCFGACPVYSIRIYRSGCVVFEGNEHVKPLGNHFTFIDRQTLEGIGRKAEELNFFDLKDEYRNPYLTDFPTVYVEVRYKGKSKRVWHYDAEPPRNLVEMEDFIDKLFNEQTTWMAFPVQNYKD
ncbi:MAG: DUF6438 domain-containing protein [Bacteroidota bacterium]